MNKEFKKLLLEAGVSENWNTADWYSLSPAMVEKFAQLIVLRCLKEIRDVDTDFFYLRMSTDDFSEKNMWSAGETACDQATTKIEQLFANHKYDF